MVTDLIKPGTSIEDAQDFCGYANVPMRLALAHVNVGGRRKTDSYEGHYTPSLDMRISSSSRFSNMIVWLLY